MIISVSYYVYYIYPWMSGSSPNLQPCSVGRTSLSEVVWLPRRRFFGGKPSWMGKFRKWWLNGDESHLMVFLKMLRIPTKSFIILRERIVIDQWFLRDPIFRPRIFGYPWIFQLRFFFRREVWENWEMTYYRSNEDLFWYPLKVARSGSFQDDSRCLDFPNSFRFMFDIVCLVPFGFQILCEVHHFFLVNTALQFSPSNPIQLCGW